MTALDFDPGSLPTDALALALFWAELGFPVLPGDPNTKKPIPTGWQHRGTTDPDQIRDWWGRRPEWRVGIKTGLSCGEPGCLDGPDVMDFDVALDTSLNPPQYKPGTEQRRRMVDAGLIDGTRVMRVRSPSETPTGRGEHWWFKASGGHNVQSDHRVWGVDLRAHHGFILTPGNPGYTILSLPWGGQDVLPDWESVAVCPGIIPKPGRSSPVRSSQRAANKQATGRVTRLVAPASPWSDDGPGALDWYVANTDIVQLAVSRGWRIHSETPDGNLMLTRPGKEIRDGASASVKQMPDDRYVMRVFTTSTELDPERTYNAAQLYAIWEHGGNESAAAREIRIRQMPRTGAMGSGPPPLRPLPPPPATADSSVGTSMGVGGAETTEGTPGGELVPVSEVGPPAMVIGFWDQKEELRAIRQLARERGVSPWALLGAVLALVTCRVGPHVVLPPIVGGAASLNLLVGLVGPSGKGKGAAWSVAIEYLDVLGRFALEEVGTSQGIDSCFTETTPKTGSVQFNDVAGFYVPEIDTIKAHSEMSGSALLPHLRKIWSGEALGARYAKTENRRPVRAHAYRASVVAGIQPARSGVLLADVDGGTPQRWLWLPVFDPDALDPRAKLRPPRYVGIPPAVDFDVWIPEGEQRGEKNEALPVTGKSRYELEVCQLAQDEIRLARYENLKTEHGSMDSHSLLTRLKVAAALAFLFRTHTITTELWELTKPIMWVSNDTRAKCVAAVAEAEKEEYVRRGKGRAYQDVAADLGRIRIKDERTARIQELGGKLLAALQSAPGSEKTPRELRILMGDAKTGKEYWSEVEKALLATPGIVQGPEISSGGRKIRKLKWAPDHILLPPSVETTES